MLPPAVPDCFCERQESRLTNYDIMPVPGIDLPNPGRVAFRHPVIGEQHLAEHRMGFYHLPVCHELHRPGSVRGG